MYESSRLIKYHRRPVTEPIEQLDTHPLTQLTPERPARQRVRRQLGNERIERRRDN